MAEACWELLMEFVQGIFGQNAVSNVPRTLQVNIVNTQTIMIDGEVCGTPTT